MTDLSELLAKLEAAEGPSRELDVMIGTLFIGPGWEAAYSLAPNAPKPTADQNAITALVERAFQGCDWEVGQAWAEHCHHAPTAPLALCIALVKAKQAEASL